MMVLREISESWLLCVLLFGSLILLVPIVGAPAIVLSGTAAAAAAVLLVRPLLANYIAIFLIYSNIVVVCQRLPFAQLIGACFIAPLGLQVLYGYVARRENLRIDRVFSLMLLFFALQLLSALVMAKDFWIAASHLMTFATEGLLLYFLVINAITSRRALANVVGAAIVAGSLLGALSLYQAVTHSYTQQFGGLAQRDLQFDQDSVPIPAAASAKSGVRVSDRAAGPLGDPNRYAQILLVLLPLAALRFRSQQSWMKRAMTLLCAGLLFSGIALSYSRGAFVTMALMIAILTVLRLIRLTHVAAIVIAGALALPFVAPNYFARIQTLIGVGGLVASSSAADTDRVIKGRATEMLASFHVFLDHPFLGVGPGQYMPFYSEQYQLDPDTQFRQVARNRRGHDLYLEMAAATGLPGLVVFVAMPLLLLTGLWRARRACARSRPDLASLATAFWFSIIAYLGTGVFLHLAFERYYWLLLALCSAALQVIHRERRTLPYPREHSTASFADALVREGK